MVKDIEYLCLYLQVEALCKIKLTSERSIYLIDWRCLYDVAAQRSLAGEPSSNSWRNGESQMVQLTAAGNSWILDPKRLARNYIRTNPHSRSLRTGHFSRRYEYRLARLGVESR